METTSLHELIKVFSKLPGLGPRSAKRIALHLIQNPSALTNLIGLLHKVTNEIKICHICGNIDVISPCNICSDHNRDTSIICVIESIADLWAMERGNVYKGLYHVLGGTLSALENRSPKDLNIASLSARIKNSQVNEVIIATNSTLEGQTTAHFIAKLLESFNIKLSRLAHGIPIGAELDYIDEGTLSFALKLRQDF